MNHLKLTITLLALTAFAAGCNTEPTASRQLDETKSETKAAAREMNDYTFEQKAELVEKLQAQLDTLNKELDLLSAKMKNSSEAVQAEARPKLEGLRDQTAQLEKRVDDVRDADESAWDSIKAASQNALDSLKDGFQQARQWLSDTIAT